MDEAVKIFNDMTYLFNIIPINIYYNILINIFRYTNHLDKAEIYIKIMFKPDIVTYY